MKNLFLKFYNDERVRYLFIGGLTMSLDLFITVSLVEAFNVNESTASMLGVAAATAFSYFFSVTFVFKKANGFNIKSFILFATSMALGLLLTKAILVLMTDVLGVYYLISKGVAIVIVIVLNYLVRKFLIFR